MGTVVAHVPGTYELHYHLVDSLGKNYQLTRNVTVADSTVPVITLTGDANLTHEAATAYLDAGSHLVGCCGR